ncbi:hypothetical protein K501DRAFT_328656 [Backusella circina FSU 941]|nr:hypothetical protein K501DRAFT_328656 [Backusella circina FSU 941]
MLQKAVIQQGNIAGALYLSSQKNMEKVPPEILHVIFTHLDLDERLKCTIICRSWWQILNKYSLFYNVEIAYNEDEFIKFMDMIKRSPHRAVQVEELCLLNCLYSSFNKRTLLNIFPNVRVLKVEWDPDAAPAGDHSYFNKPIEITYSQSKVRVLYDSAYCELASQMITSNLYGRLEDLYLNFSSIVDVSTCTLLDQLKNIPILKTLTLEALSIGINNLENIHDNLPTLQEFNLIYIRITTSKIPANITPVTSITSLKIIIDRAEDIEAHIQFYQYLTKKYAKTTVVGYLDLQLDSHLFTDAKRVYLSGILGFFRRMRPRKKALEMENVPDDLKVFEMCDSIKYQFEELNARYCEDVL